LPTNYFLEIIKCFLKRGGCYMYKVVACSQAERVRWVQVLDDIKKTKPTSEDDVLAWIAAVETIDQIGTKLRNILSGAAESGICFSSIRLRAIRTVAIEMSAQVDAFIAAQDVEAAYKYACLMPETDSDAKLRNMSYGQVVGPHAYHGARDSALVKVVSAFMDQNNVASAIEVVPQIFEIEKSKSAIKIIRTTREGCRQYGFPNIWKQDILDRSVPVFGAWARIIPDIRIG
jgi:hypothetical protein